MPLPASRTPARAPGPEPARTPARGEAGAGAGEHALALATHPGAVPGRAAPPADPPPPAAPKTLRRKCAGCEDELVVRRVCAQCAAAEEVEARTGIPQPRCAACQAEEGQALQRAPSDGGVAADGAAGAAREGGPGDAVREVIGAGQGRPLDPGTRAFFEARFGAGLGDVRVHTGPAADASARAVDALAYTVGRDVVFRAGGYAPESAQGRRLLAHELAHTLQQGQAGGRSLQGFTVVRPNDPSEREADAAADAAVRGQSVPPLATAPAAIARDAGGAGAPRQPDASVVSAAADRILDRLEGYTSRWDSEAILNEFSDTDAAFDRALLDELRRRDPANLAWLFEDMTEEDGRTLRARLIKLHAAGNLLELIADDVVNRLRGWTSENDSHAILADFNGLTGGEVDTLLGLIETKGGQDAEGTRGWLFGDLDRVSGFKLAETLYAAGTPRATSYAAGWTVDRVYSMISGYTSHTDSSTIVSALEQVPAEHRSYVQYRLDAVCRSGRDQSAEDSLMEDLDAGDYARVQKMDGYTLRPYDRQPEWYEAGWETIVSWIDYGLVLVQWIACGLAGIVTGILSVVWDIVVLVKDIVVAVWDLLGSLVYLLSGGAAGSAEWLAVKDFFSGIGHLFSDPGAVFSQMWEELKLEFDTIEGPLTQCRRAEYIVRKFINALVNIILIFVAGAGAAKMLAKGVQGVAEFAALVREVGFVKAVAQVSGEVVGGAKKFLAVSATRVGELGQALRAPVKTLATVRGRVSAVLMAAEEEGYWRYLRTQAGTAARGALEDEAKFWSEQKNYWKTRGQAQQAREAALSQEMGELDAGLKEGKAPETADKAISDADESAKALDKESADLHDEVTGKRETKAPAETKPVETKPGETKPGETRPGDEKAPTGEKEGVPGEGEKKPGEGEKKPGAKLPEEEGVTAKETTPDGQHEVRVKNHAIERCSNHCELCRRVHGPLLEERPDLNRVLLRLEGMEGDDALAGRVAHEAALLDQRARNIYDLRALSEADLQARAAAAGDVVAANEARFELARRARPELTYEAFARETLGTALGEATAGELETAFGREGLPGLVDEVGSDNLGRLLNGATPDELADLSASIGNGALRSLGMDLTGTEVKALLEEWSEATVGWAASELRGNQVRPLLTGLDEGAMRHLRDVRPSELLDIKTRLGAPLLSTLGAEVDASALREMLASLSEETVRGVIDQHIARNRIADLNDYGRNLAQARVPVASGGTGELVAPPPVTPASVVIDTQMSIYINEGRAGLMGGTPWTGLTARQQTALDYLIEATSGEVKAGLAELKSGKPWSGLSPARQDAVRTLSPASGGLDLRVGPVVIAEEGAPGAGLARTGFDIPVSRNSPQYQGVLQELENIPNMNAAMPGQTATAPVGGAGSAGAADRAVVADAFFAAKPGVPATLVTADETTYKALAQMAGINPRTAGGPLHVVYKGGFVVTSPSTGLQIKVIPIK